MEPPREKIDRGLKMHDKVPGEEALHPFVLDRTQEEVGRKMAKKGGGFKPLFQGQSKLLRPMASELVGEGSGEKEKETGLARIVTEGNFHGRANAGRQKFFTGKISLGGEGLEGGAGHDRSPGAIRKGVHGLFERTVKSHRVLAGTGFHEKSA
jgi:hypothetical protein